MQADNDNVVTIKNNHKYILGYNTNKWPYYIINPGLIQKYTSMLSIIL